MVLCVDLNSASHLPWDVMCELLGWKSSSGMQINGITMRPWGSEHSKKWEGHKVLTARKQTLQVLMGAEDLYTQEQGDKANPAKPESLGEPTMFLDQLELTISQCPSHNPVACLWAWTSGKSCKLEIQRVYYSHSSGACNKSIHLLDLRSQSEKEFWFSWSLRSFTDQR